MVWLPARRSMSLVKVVGPMSYQRSMTSRPSMYNRTPSSVDGLKRYRPPPKLTVRVQRTEKLSGGICGAGDPAPQLKLMDASFRTTAGEPESERLEKYSPRQGFCGGGTSTRFHERRATAPPAAS